jgi:hypothetical protein
MKKYMPGFVPVNFEQAGRILLVLGLICLALKAASLLLDWFEISAYILWLGIGSILVGLYLIFVVAKNNLNQ